MMQAFSRWRCIVEIMKCWKCRFGQNEIEYYYYYFYFRLKLNIMPMTEVVCRYICGKIGLFDINCENVCDVVMRTYIRYCVRVCAV